MLLAFFLVISRSPIYILDMTCWSAILCCKYLLVCAWPFHSLDGAFVVAYKSTYLFIFLFYFSFTIYIQYYFVVVSGVQHVVRQSYTLLSVPPNISTTHLASYIIITILSKLSLCCT